MTRKRVVGWARYHSDYSEEARKYRSNVELQRTTAKGVRIVAWLKPAEAEAIARAAHEERDVHLPRAESHGEIFIQHFPSRSQEAVTYRSVTRLLRRGH